MDGAPDVPAYARFGGGATPVGPTHATRATYAWS